MLFPAGFLWGTAISSHQTEGGNFNDWTEWEIKNAKIKNQNAKLKSWPAYVLNDYPNPLQEENYISSRACDHYNRYEEDFDIAKKLNNNALRFSIEWSRVEPREGEWDQKEVEHYRNVLRALRARDIEPFVTLWHWTNPVWFAEKGAWLNKEAPFYFARYAEKIVKELGNLANFWIILNEPAVLVSSSYWRGLWPSQKNGFLASYRALNNLAKAHNLAYEKIIFLKPQSRIGIAYNFIRFEAYKENFFNRIIKYLADYLNNHYFLGKIKRKMNFIGCNYYFYNRIKFNLFHPVKSLKDNENKFVSDIGWEIFPKGIYHILKNLKKYNLPVYITENGVADAQDKYRADFIKDHLLWMHKAIQEGVDVRGYFYWSLLDNFEWDKGFWPRFGLVEVDYKTMERKVRQSAWEYAEICRNNEIML
ncbi:MAG: hypothetical protein US76_01140 [Parcubacteria group bacterium GW2011_GWA2_38_13b]|nr:MAG: hypothetical protein US76_01140 [Parcubacteria group bacterium GW2011_GWA2_38_13b]